MEAKSCVCNREAMRKIPWRGTECCERRDELMQTKSLSETERWSQDLGMKESKIKSYKIKCNE